jgi:two-component system sensor histidine kinase PfeS
MSRLLFWQLNISFLAVSLITFSGLHYISALLTVSMTELRADHQSLLTVYAQRAEAYQLQNDTSSLLALTTEIREEQGVWSGLIMSDHRVISSEPIPENINLGFQRHVYWPIHHFMTDVVIGIEFTDPQSSFVIELPVFMYPRVNTTLVHNFLTFVVPSFLLMLFCWGAYRYLMRPIEALNKGTIKLAKGELSARVLPEISSNRRDELTQVAASFDGMADRIERLVNSQRQLLGDLSHELRTPLTRISLAIDICKESDEKREQLLPRLEREVGQMDSLVENALTLAWLDSDPVFEREDEFNLSTLLNLVIEDAEFEYPNRIIQADFSEKLIIRGSSQQVLSQCVENVLRNALKYSPEDKAVLISCTENELDFRLSISDFGLGVAAEHLDKIFEPFFRTDKARSRELGGFGLGLALCKRQMIALGGDIWAELNDRGGLSVYLSIPQSGVLIHE